MGSYRVVSNTIVPTAAMTGTTVITSQTFDISSYQSCSFQPTWTGTPTGTFTVEASNDGSNWADIGASVTGNPAGSASSTFIPVYAICSKYIRLKYTNASGVGVLAGGFFGKTR